MFLLLIKVEAVIKNCFIGTVEKTANFNTRTLYLKIGKSFATLNKTITDRLILQTPDFLEMK